MSDANAGSQLEIEALKADVSRHDARIGDILKLLDMNQKSHEVLFEIDRDAFERSKYLLVMAWLSTIATVQMISRQRIWNKRKIRRQLEKFPIPEPKEGNRVSGQFHESLCQMHALLLRATRWRSGDVVAEAWPIIAGLLSHSHVAF